jgi:hypothetical protein
VSVQYLIDCVDGEVKLCWLGHRLFKIGFRGGAQSFDTGMTWQRHS